MGKVSPASGRRLRAYAFTLVTTAVVLMFALAEWAAEKYVADRSRTAGVALEVAIVLIAAVVFRPVHQRVEAAVERAFYKRKHEALAALAKFRRELSSFNDLQQLLRRVIEAVEQYLEAHACAVYLRRERYHAEASSFEVAAGDIDVDDPLVIRLRSTSAPAQPPLLNSSVQGTHAFPMTAAGDLVGILVVHCRHGDYDVEEAQMLTGLAQDLAVAVAALDPRLRAAKTHPNNIPADLPLLVGRDREMGEVKAALSQSRLVTLTGSGGVGKTCIALHCAAGAVAQHEDGAWFVNLAPILDGNLIAGTMLSALRAGAAEQGGDLDGLLEHLRSRNALLVIDNCEQIVGDVASVIAKIRATCPEVTILATSRETFHLEGEQVYRLGPLRSEAGAELFCRRAAAVLPEFDPQASAADVSRICERLDGIPLAIELAAARVRTLSASEILEHLDARFRLLTSGARGAMPRQQTLAATIEWSYGLLTAEEQSLFLRLAAFRGSFALAAAAAVCAQGGTCDEFHVLDVLTSLADKSLVIVTLGLTTRYRLLETIREFAAQKALEQRAAAIAQQQHAAYFAALAAHAYHEFDTRLPQGWLDRLAPDLDNFRAALVFTLEGPGDRHVGAQLAADCGPMFLRLGLLAEGLRWCDAARNVGDLSPGTAGRIEYVAAMMHHNLGSSALALACAQRAADYYDSSSDERGVVRALSQVAQQLADAKRFEEAAVPAERAIRRARELGDPRILISVLRRCASSLPPQEIERARALFGEALDAARRSSDQEESHLLLVGCARSEAAAGFLARAVELTTEALGSADRTSRLYLETNIALWCLALGRSREARPHAREALKSAVEMQHPLGIAFGITYLAPFHAARNAEEAAMLLGYGKTRLRELNWNVERDEKAALENVASIIKTELHGADFADLVFRGGSLTQEQALGMLEPTLTGGWESHDAAIGAGDRVGTLLS